MGPYRAFTLDFYGTLVSEDDALIAGIVRRLSESSDAAIDAAALGRRWSTLFAETCSRSHGAQFRTQREIEQESLRTLLAELGSDLDAHELSSELFSYWEAPDVFDEAFEFLERAQLPCCVVSNIDHADLESALAHTRLPLREIVTSESSRAYKPRAAPFEHALERLRVAPHQVLHVGDSLGGDVAGARALGIDVGWINRSARPIPDPAPTYVAPTLLDLLDQLED